MSKRSRVPTRAPGWSWGRQQEVFSGVGGSVSDETGQVITDEHT